MADVKSADLNIEIGEMIVENFECRHDNWVGISLVATFFEGSEECSGYQYFDDGSFEAGGVSNFGEFMDKLLKLRDCMEQNGEGTFVQCLIHITKPNYALRIQYEYENPERWWPSGPSANMNAFADLLRPEEL